MQMRRNTSSSHLIHGGPLFQAIKPDVLAGKFRMWFQYSVFIARISSPDRCHTMQYDTTTSTSPSVARMITSRNRDRQLGFSHCFSLIGPPRPTTHQQLPGRKYQPAQTG